MFLFKHLFQKPLTTQLTISSNNGFHLRPVAQFSSLAKSFSCSITATFHDKTADAKSVNTLLSLSLEKGDTFILQTQGKKADEALESLRKLFDTLMKSDVQIEKIVKKACAYTGALTHGDIIFEGIAIAPIHPYERSEVQYENNVSFQEALGHSSDDLETLYRSHQKDSNSTIYLAQKELLVSLGAQCETIETFVQLVANESKKLLGTKLESKNADYQDILQRVKQHLGLETKVTFPDTPFILVSDDLLPSEIDVLTDTQILGVILKESSIHSHTAILLRAAGIPSLIVDVRDMSQDKPVILDTYAGVLVHSPSDEDMTKARAEADKDQSKKTLASQMRFNPSVTKQGKHIKVYANVEDVRSAQTAKEEGAEGIGLLRSEFLFKENKPSLKTQQKAYEEIFSYFDDITVRTLDVGGDKALPYIQIPLEDNPFLGIRGVRLFRTHPEILEEQLEAIFRAAGNKPLKIMFPMVSTVEEFTQAKSFAQNVAEKYHLEISNILFGIMIEVPSVLFLLESFNEVVDFYSIGTNDLTQYLFATERTHPILKVDDLSPVLFSAIDIIIQKATKPVSICGELAANKAAIDKLVNLGLKTLSVSPKSIAQTKELIRHV